MTRTITLRDILSFCKRRSGRTTEIIKDCIDFIFADINDSNIIVVMVANNKIIDFYFKILKEEVHYRNNNDIILKFGHVTNEHTRRKIIFLTPDKIDVFRGVRYKDVYFDTPEIDVFSEIALNPALVAGLTDD